MDREPARVCGLDKALVHDDDGTEAHRDLKRDVALDAVLRLLAGMQPPVELGRRLGAGCDAGRGRVLGELRDRLVREDATITSSCRPCSASTPASASS